MIPLIVILCILILICGPILYFFEGFIVGIILKITIGGLFVQGLSALGIHINLNDIPIICGTISLIGSFFKNINPNKFNFFDE